MNIGPVTNPSQLIVKKRNWAEPMWLCTDTSMISISGVTYMQVIAMVLLREDCTDLRWRYHFKGGSARVHAENKLSGLSLSFYVLRLAINFDLPLLVVDLVCRFDLEETCLYVYDI